MRALVCLFLVFFVSACAPVSTKWVNKDPKANLQVDEELCRRDLTIAPASDGQTLWVDQALREKSFTKCMRAKGWQWGSE